MGRKRKKESSPTPQIGAAAREGISSGNRGRSAPFLDLPEAPTFYPTLEQFQDPVSYIRSIRQQGEKAGICKIVPPKGWKPPFALDLETFRFQTKTQIINELQHRASGGVSREAFRRNLSDYWEESRGNPLARWPTYQGEEIDLCKLYHLVKRRGGYNLVSANRQWRDVAAAMNLPGQAADSSNAPQVLRGHYRRILYDYELLQAAPASDDDDDAPPKKTTRAPTAPKSPQKAPAKRAKGVTPGPDRSGLGTLSLAGGLSTPCAVASGEEGKGRLTSDAEMDAAEAFLEFGCRAAAEAEQGQLEVQEEVGQLDTEEGRVDPSAVQAETKSSQGGFAWGDSKKSSATIPGSMDPPTTSATRPTRTRTPSRYIADTSLVPPWGGHHHNNHPAAAAVAAAQMEDAGADQLCEMCGVGGHGNVMLLCDRCDCGYHMYCLAPPVTTIPEGDWFCPRCVLSSGEGFGFLVGKEYSLPEFREFARAFKVGWFGSETAVARAGPERIESEFWKIVEGGGTDSVHVAYGSDLDTSYYGSGFPQLDEDEEEGEEDGEARGDGGGKGGGSGRGRHGPEWVKYATSGWNLNNLPKLPGSMLRFIDDPIPGVMVPWLYVGMCFSAFCWHFEDHSFYSLNYHHWGEPKTWYGVPGHASADFQAVMKASVPGLFEAQPDLMFHLVTLLSPRVLVDKCVPVCRLVQREGEFVVTFPRSYHAGFNHGLNCAEAVNLAPADWLPYGGVDVSRYRYFRRSAIISHEQLLLVIGAHNEYDAETARWLLPELVRVTALERQLREALCAKGVVHSQRMRPHADPSRINEEEDAQCAICRYHLYLSAVTCRCAGDKAACLQHSRRLCDCSPSNWRLLYRYTLAEMDDVVRRARDVLASAPAPAARSAPGIAGNVPATHASAPGDAATDVAARRGNAGAALAAATAVPANAATALAPANDASGAAAMPTDPLEDDAEDVYAAVHAKELLGYQEEDTLEAELDRRKHRRERREAVSPRTFEEERGEDGAGEDGEDGDGINRESRQRRALAWCVRARRVLTGTTGSISAAEELLGEAEDFLWDGHNMDEVHDTAARLRSAVEWASEVEAFSAAWTASGAAGTSAATAAGNASASATNNNPGGCASGAGPQFSATMTLERLEELAAAPRIPFAGASVKAVLAALEATRELEGRVSAALEGSALPELRLLKQMLTEVTRLPVMVTSAESLAERHSRAQAWLDRARRVALNKPVRLRGTTILPTREELASLQAESETLQVYMPEIGELADAVQNVNTWEARADAALTPGHQPRRPLKYFQDLLVESEMLLVAVPQADALRACIAESVAWTDAAREAMARRSADALESMRELVSSAEQLLAEPEDLPKLRATLENRGWLSSARGAVSRGASITELGELLERGAGLKGVDRELLDELARARDAAVAWRGQVAGLFRDGGQLEEFVDVARAGGAISMADLGEEKKELDRWLAVGKSWRQKATECMRAPQATGGRRRGGGGGGGGGRGGKGGGDGDGGGGAVPTLPAMQALVDEASHMPLRFKEVDQLNARIADAHAWAAQVLAALAECPLPELEFEERADEGDAGFPPPSTPPPGGEAGQRSSAGAMVPSGDIKVKVLASDDGVNPASAEAAPAVVVKTESVTSQHHAEVKLEAGALGSGCRPPLEARFEDVDMVDGQGGPCTGRGGAPVDSNAGSNAGTPVTDKRADLVSHGGPGVDAVIPVPSKDGGSPLKYALTSRNGSPCVVHLLPLPAHVTTRMRSQVATLQALREEWASGVGVGVPEKDALEKRVGALAAVLEVDELVHGRGVAKSLEAVSALAARCKMLGLDERLVLVVNSILQRGRAWVARAEQLLAGKARMTKEEMQEFLDTADLPLELVQVTVLKAALSNFRRLETKIQALVDGGASASYDDVKAMLAKVKETPLVCDEEELLASVLAEADNWKNACRKLFARRSSGNSTAGLLAIVKASFLSVMCATACEQSGMLPPATSASVKEVTTGTSYAARTSSAMGVTVEGDAGVKSSSGKAAKGDAAAKASSSRAPAKERGKAAASGTKAGRGEKGSKGEKDKEKRKKKADKADAPKEKRPRKDKAAKDKGAAGGKGANGTKPRKPRDKDGKEKMPRGKRSAAAVAGSTPTTGAPNTGIAPKKKRTAVATAAAAAAAAASAAAAGAAVMSTTPASASAPLSGNPSPAKAIVEKGRDAQSSLAAATTLASPSAAQDVPPGGAVAILPFCLNRPTGRRTTVTGKRSAAAAGITIPSHASFSEPPLHPAIPPGCGDGEPAMLSSQGQHQRATYSSGGAGTVHSACGGSRGIHDRGGLTAGPADLDCHRDGGGGGGGSGLGVDGGIRRGQSTYVQSTAAIRRRRTNLTVGRSHGHDGSTEHGSCDGMEARGGGDGGNGAGEGSHAPGLSLSHPRVCVVITCEAGATGGAGDVSARLRHLAGVVDEAGHHSWMNREVSADRAAAAVVKVELRVKGGAVGRGEGLNQPSVDPLMDGMDGPSGGAAVDMDYGLSLLVPGRGQSGQEGQGGGVAGAVASAEMPAGAALAGVPGMQAVGVAGYAAAAAAAGADGAMGAVEACAAEEDGTTGAVEALKGEAHEGTDASDSEEEGEDEGDDESGEASSDSDEDEEVDGAEQGRRVDVKAEEGEATPPGAQEDHPGGASRPRSPADVDMEDAASGAPAMKGEGAGPHGMLAGDVDAVVVGAGSPGTTAIIMVKKEQGECLDGSGFNGWPDEGRTCEEDVMARLPVLASGASTVGHERVASGDGIIQVVADAGGKGGPGGRGEDGCKGGDSPEGRLGRGRGGGGGAGGASGSGVLVTSSSSNSEARAKMHAQLLQFVAPAGLDLGDADVVDALASAGAPRFCVCQKEYDAGQPMICCDACNDWFHTKCVGLTQVEAKAMKHYQCPLCLAHCQGTPFVAGDADLTSRVHQTKRPTLESVRELLALADELKCRVPEVAALRVTIALAESWQRHLQATIASVWRRMQGLGQGEETLATADGTATTAAAIESMETGAALEGMGAGAPVQVGEAGASAAAGATSPALAVAQPRQGSLPPGPELQPGQPAPDVEQALMGVTTGTSGVAAGASIGAVAAVKASTKASPPRGDMTVDVGAIMDAENRGEEAPTVEVVMRALKRAVSVELCQADEMSQLERILRLHWWRHRAMKLLRPTTTAIVTAAGASGGVAQAGGDKGGASALPHIRTFRRILREAALVPVDDSDPVLAEVTSLERCATGFLSSCKKITSDGNAPLEAVKLLMEAGRAIPVNLDKELKMLEERSTLYCTCRKPWDSKQPMICCDVCQEWFHYACLGMPEPDSDDDEGDNERPEGAVAAAPDQGEFICPACQSLAPPRPAEAPATSMALSPQALSPEVLPPVLQESACPEVS
eukprot:jgi/Mesvir1/27557/Mv07307-RA.2